MNNTIDERRKLAIEAAKGRLLEETIEDFDGLRQKVYSSSGVSMYGVNHELDRLTIELLKVVELKKIASILAEKE
jgi:hypothetical protein